MKSASGYLSFPVASLNFRWPFTKKCSRFCIRTILLLRFCVGFKSTFLKKQHLLTSLLSQV